MTTEKRMKFGFSIPPFGALADPDTLVELAVTAEANGWDGIFIWDHILFDDLFRPMFDPWIALAAIAMKTKRLRIGAMVTPLARRRAWQVARQVVSLDHLSQGRMVLGVGLGSDRWDFRPFGEETNPKVRAAMLEEGLAIIKGLWSGEPFSFDGEHNHLDEMVFLPRPVQQPRIPVWVAGRWPNKAPMRRAARWDGVFPLEVATPDDWRELLAYINQHRTSDGPFDVVHGGKFPADPAEASAQATALAEAGVTWWVQDCTPMIDGLTWADHGWATQIAPIIKAQIAGPPPTLG